MLDIKKIEESPEEYKKDLKARRGDPADIDKLLEANVDRKKKILDAEEMKSELNRVTKEIAKNKAAKIDSKEMIESMRSLGGELKGKEKAAEDAKKFFEDLLSRLPNKSHESVPEGFSEEENIVTKTYGEKRELAFKALTHDELGEKLGIIDFDRAAKVTGARFAFLRSAGARLERALAQFMLDLHTEEHGYEEFITPYMVNDASLFGTGQFPKFADDVFHIQQLPYHLIPTAEVSLTNFYAGEILKEEDLPISFAAFTPCFRSEAGSHGRDTKGLIRQHQFHKVELVHFSHPENSYQMHEKLTLHAEEVLKRLDLSYQVVVLCKGDIGFGAAKCHDINVWLPGQKAYREISSCSNCEDFQARRANIRFKGANGKPQFVHTLNGSGLAVGRTLIAVMENYQQEDGSIRVPEVLQKYMNGLKIIE